jgi:lysophospholipase L1-like esterase
MKGDHDLNLIKAKLADPKPLTWVFVGDSITQGAFHTFGWRIYPEIFAEHVRFECNRRLDVIINTGISGNTIQDILNHLDWRVLRFKPDIVFLMIGTNDSTMGPEGVADFRNGITRFIENVRRADSIPVITTPNPILIKYSPDRKDIVVYIDALREIAEIGSVVLIDHYRFWKTVKPDVNSMMMWLNDNLHPNEYGHREIANQIFRCLDIFNEKPTCKFWIP